MSSKKVDLLACIFCLLLGIFVLYASKDFPKAAENVHGADPAFYPRLLSLVLIFLGLLLFVKEGISQFRKSSPSLHRDNQIGGKKNILVLLMVGASICVACLMKYLGFFLASAIFLMGSMVLIKPTRKGKDLLIYVIITGGILFCIYFIFELLFRVQLPQFRFSFFTG